MFDLFKSELVAKAEWLYETRSPRGVMKALLMDGTGAMFLYRLLRWSRKRRRTPGEVAANRLNRILNGCTIGRGAEFGASFVLVHSGGVVINGAVRRGVTTVIEHQVTVGAERRMSPQLGNYVFIGAGAKVIGGIIVGDRAKIGPDAVVVKDVPAGATAVGVPARIIYPKPQQVHG